MQNMEMAKYLYLYLMGNNNKCYNLNIYSKNPLKNIKCIRIVISNPERFGHLGKIV